MTNKSVIYFSATLLLLSLTASSQSLLENPVTDSLVGDDDTDDNELAKYDPENAIRQSARNGGETEMVDASDMQKLRDRTNANISQTLSNTSLADLESDNLTQLLQSRYRERKRQERLLVIQTQILRRLRMNRQPNISANVFSEEEQRRINAIVKRVHQFNNHKDNSNSENSTSNPRPAFEQQFGDDSGATPRTFRFHTTVQKVQSFYPSCSLPNNTEKNMWELPGSLRVYYELPLSRYSSGPEMIVILARLRLYKISPVQPDVSDPDLTYLSRYNLIETLIHTSPSNVINVRVYQYVKPLRTNRKERKRLVDTMSLPVEHEGWVDFNVVTSINFWLRHNNKNFGFDIGVEDAFGNKLNPNLFFRTMNCSCKESIPQDPPFPHIIKINREMVGENDSSLFDNETYPTLDLQTADVTTYDSTTRFHLYQQSSSPFPNGEETSRRIMRKRHLSLRQQHSQQRRQQLSEVLPRSLMQGNSQEGSCRKETVRVSVSDLKLENVVIYPKELQWTFCAGSCAATSSEEEEETQLSQMPWNSNASSFSKVGGLLRSIIKHIRLNSEPKCVAGSYKSLPVIYSGGEGDELEGAILEDLVPTECYCKS